MVEINLKTKERPEKDPLDDDPIPTYQEWLDDAAGRLSQDKWFGIAKFGIDLVKYLFTREQLMIQLLLQKDVIQEHEVEELFGDKSHSEAQKRGLKKLTKYCCRAASRGELHAPDGTQIDPDTVLVVLNDILDFNNTGWGGKAFESFMDLSGHGETVRQSYKEEVKEIVKLNAVRELRRNQKKRMAESAVKGREERERKVRIFVSKCKVAEKPLPSDEDQQQMVEGTKPIPAQP